MTFEVTVHPMKSDPWWPTCLGYTVEARDKSEATAKAITMARQCGMGKSKKVVCRPVSA